MPKIYSPHSYRREKKRWNPLRFLREQKTRREHLSFGERRRREIFRRITSSLINIGVLAFVFGLAFIGFIFIWTSRDLPDPNKLLDRKINESTTIYDSKEENILYSIHGDINRKIIALADLPEYMKWATITAEDRNFYEHNGISIKGMIRSAIYNTFFGTNIGGSTITQQFVKNAILTTEKTYTRKIKEIILSYRIEKKFSKDQILQLYFNEIPYGSVLYGVEAASQSFFGKSARDIDLAQVAILAAIPQRPTYFSPYGSHLNDLFQRQQWILDSMVELGYIKKTDAEVAKKERIEFKPKAESMVAPHFVMYVRELLSDEYGERFIEDGGFKVITTLDLDWQKKAEKAVADQLEKNKTYNANNAALVAIDTKTGQIRAMVGSADFNDEEIDGQVNVAISPRQPGSSFKPLAYVTAFEKGFTPDTVLYDINTTFKNYPDDYSPKNYDLKEHGPVTMRTALAGSLNIPAVKTLYLAGIDNILDTTKKLGYTTFSDRSRFGLSLVLGGGEVKLLEHTAAYATFAREGVYHVPAAILKIIDKDNKTIYEWKNDEKTVMDAEPIRNLTSILTDNSARAYIFGEKNYLTLGDRPVAAKTGTTNDYRDAWTMGYTPSVAAGVWVGNSDNTEMKRGADGSVVAAPIWNRFMQSILGDTPEETFNAPQPNTAEKPVLRGVAGGSMPIKIDRASGKLATEYTPASFIEEKIFSQAHCILYYVNKDDPQGPPPSDPFSDPQFASWEDAVQLWAKNQNFTNQSPPTQYDDLHIPANFPYLKITTPQNGQTIADQTLNVNIESSSLRGIRRAEYYLDDTLFQTINTSPFNLVASINSIGNGIHKLTVRVFDDIDNSAEQSIELNFLK